AFGGTHNRRPLPDRKRAATDHRIGGRTILRGGPKMKRQPSYPQISIIAQGTAYCTVCAPLTMDQGIIETVVGLRNRGEPKGKWKVPEGAPFWRPNPRPCPHDEHRQHWLLMLVQQTERHQPDGTREHTG